ncbi:hypothetical protein ACFL3H_04150 [Gemmatimonadota bacterium]
MSIETMINAGGGITPVPACLRDRLVGYPEKRILSATIYLFLFLVPGQSSRAQIPPPDPAPMAVSIGVTWAIPLADLALQSPGNILLEDPGDGRYATGGTAMTQRIAFAISDPIGVFFQATFTSFGVDTAAVQADYSVSPPVVGGKNEMVTWSIGVRWRGGQSWQKGPYAEAMIGRYRARTELKQKDLDPVGETFTWELGWGVAGGWIVSVGPSLALDIGVVLHEFREDYFINRWFGLRTMAVMTFGGDR